MGLLASAMPTAAFVPQAWKTWHTGSATDFTLALLVCLDFGAMVRSAGLVLANIITVPLTFSILWVKLRRG